MSRRLHPPLEGDFGCIGHISRPHSSSPRSRSSSRPAGPGTRSVTKRPPRSRASAAGAVRGIAVVTGDPLKGIENLSGDYSSAAKLFGYRFNCSGRGVQVRKSPSLTAVDVRFVGNASRIAIVNAIGGEPAGVSVAPQPDGSFRVSLAARSDQPDGNSFVPKALGILIVAL